MVNICRITERAKEERDRERERDEEKRKNRGVGENGIGREAEERGKKLRPSCSVENGLLWPARRKNASSHWNRTYKTRSTWGRQPDSHRAGVLFLLHLHRDTMLSLLPPAAASQCLGLLGCCCRSEPMLVWCWATVCDGGPTSNQHLLNVARSFAGGAAGNSGTDAIKYTCGVIRQADRRPPLYNNAAH